MKIQILFLHKADWLGRLIQKLSNGNMTHCGIVINDLCLVDTNFGRDFGVRFIPWNSCDYELITLNLRHVQYEEAIDWIREHEGIPYDNWNNVWWLLGKKSNGVAKLNCTESVVEFLCDISFLNKIYLEMNLSPSELYEILKSKSSQ